MNANSGETTVINNYLKGHAQHLQLALWGGPGPSVWVCTPRPQTHRELQRVGEILLLLLLLPFTHDILLSSEHAHVDLQQLHPKKYSLHGVLI